MSQPWHGPGKGQLRTSQGSALGATAGLGALWITGFEGTGEVGGQQRNPTVAAVRSSAAVPWGALWRMDKGIRLETSEQEDTPVRLLGGCRGP